jgi:alkylation response protein AidB-like acyl-CoA dehydrogenase
MVAGDVEAGTELDAETVLAAVDQLLREHPPATTPPQEFLGARFDAGLAWVHFPVGYGGLAAPRKLGPVVAQRLAAANAPHWESRNNIGYGMCAPTIVTQGSDDQKRRYLRRLFTCEDIWCQLFSEPGAGSDVASLSTRAVRDGDEWVINGQKVWTTSAHIARYGMLLARSDPEVVKHKGLTYFVVDMHAPGVEVRPLRQITGDAEFNEVFFSDVRIPDTERLSEVGDGWQAGLVTLMNERVAIGSNVSPRGSGPIAFALAEWNDTVLREPVRRDRLAALWIDAEVLRLTNLRAAASRRRGTPGPQGSIAKLMFALLIQRIYEFCISLKGPSGQLYESYAMDEGEEVLAHRRRDIRWLFLRGQASTIAGGTSDIQRNIIGERVLGLPVEVRADLDKPWSQVPRN